MDQTNEWISQKEKLVAQLLDEISNTKQLTDKTALITDLVHHFKDERIFPFLQDMLQDNQLEPIHGFLVGACTAYSLEECKASMSFFIDLLAHGSYEAAMAAAQLLLRLMDTYKLEKAMREHFQTKLNYFLHPTVQQAALKYELEK
ncbi:hypothetical protein GCM10028791_27560 [Echinicola sediminis]